MVEEHKQTFMSDALRDYCDVYLKEMQEKENCDSKHWFSGQYWLANISTAAKTFGFSLRPRC